MAENYKKFILSQIWRAEFWNQDAGMATLPLKFLDSLAPPAFGGSRRYVVYGSVAPITAFVFTWTSLVS